MSADLVDASASLAGVARPREPRRYSSVVVACAAALGGLAGFYAARNWAHQVAAFDRSFDRDALGANANGTNAPHTWDAWLARATTTIGKVPSPELRQELAHALIRSPALRQEVIERYSREARRPYRVVIKDMLVASRLPEVTEAARQLATRASDLARGAGFELLAALEPGAESYVMARRAVETEADPGVLAGALMALRPVAPPSQTEAGAMLPRLVELSRHADPLVRAHALQQVAEWDKIGDQTTPLVVRALADGDMVVRQAAVGAVMLGRLRSDDVKRGLLQVLCDPAEDMTTRGAALFALERFPLSDAEQATYLAQRRDLEQRAMAHQ